MKNGPGIGLLLGFLLVGAAFFPKEPRRDELRLVEGDIQSSTVVKDWYGRAKRIDFELRGNSLRYWTDRLPHELTTSRLGNPPIHVAFYAQFSGAQPRTTLAGTVKTYGLSVNGREIISVEDYVAGEAAFRRYVMLPIGLLAVTIGAIAVYRRRHIRCRP